MGNILISRCIPASCYRDVMDCMLSLTNLSLIGSQESGIWLVHSNAHRGDSIDVVPAIKRAARGVQDRNPRPEPRGWLQIGRR